MDGERIGIVMVNWNGWRITQETLASLRAVRFPWERLAIYLVDNGSTDGSVERLSQEPGVTLLALEENLGFAGGSNAGIRRALADGCEYVLLLNNDVYVHPDFLRPLVRWLTEHPNAGIVTPKIRYADPEHLIWYAGGVLRWPRILGGMVGMGETDRGQYDTPAVVGFATGCCILVRREVFETVGLLDETFYFYQEDVDFCMWATQAGFEIWYRPESLIWHRVSHSTAGDLPLRTYLYAQSRFIFFAKHIHGWRWTIVVLLEIVRLVRTVVGHIFRGQSAEAVAYTKGLFNGIQQACHVPSIQCRRR